MRPASLAPLIALALAGCLSSGAGSDDFVVMETVLDLDVTPRPPLITVEAASGAPLTRDDWALAEATARAHCDGQGARFDLLPAARAYPQVQYDSGLWSFVARCVSGG